MRIPLMALTAGLLTSLTPLTASADTALLVINDRYTNAQNLREGNRFANLSTRLRDAGFDLITVNDGDGDEMRQGLELLLDADEDERIVIAALGHFARSDTDSWLLGTDAREPSLASVSGDGLSLSVMMEVASSAPGRAVIMLGLERRRMDLGTGLSAGLGGIDPPQGVTVIAGAPEDITQFTRNSLLVPGTNLAAAMSDARLRAFGFLSPSVAFIPTTAGPAPQPQPQPQPPAPNQPGAEEVALWNAAVELNTLGAFRAYLNRYPAGFFATDARTQINAFENDPSAIAQGIEDALGLSREQRQHIQRSLSILDYNTRGIDGIFGPGTRNAIRGWQTSRGFFVTGYLDVPQINALGSQAAVRTSELEAEARAAREAEERADRAYWQVTGQGTSEEGLRAYLQRYPDGLYAEIAEERVDEIERAARADAAARDRAAWDVARGADTIPAYRGYLAEFEEGAFTTQAQNRINQLSGIGGGLSEAQLAQFAETERRMNLPSVTRSLIEQRLAALGLEPGRVDGRFDNRSRRAIRRYQQVRGLDATGGYLNQVTVVRLLAETVGDILR